MKKASVNAKYFINAAISVLVMVLFRFVPPFGAMTPLGMEILGIFLGVLWAWINCDMVWPSVLAFISIGFSGFSESVAATITGALTNGTVQLILWLFVFSAILTVSGISAQLANRLVSSKFCKGHPWRLSLVIFAACYVSAIFGAGIAGILICWEFVYMICKQVGYSKTDKWPRMMLVGIVFTNCVGGVVMPFNVGVVASFGYLTTASDGLWGAYDFLTYIVFSLAVSLSALALYTLISKLILKPDMSKLRENVDIGKVEAFNMKQKIAIGALIAIIIVTVLPSMLPKGFFLKTFLNKMGVGALVLTVCAAITLFRDKQGKPYFTFQELGSRGVMWNIFFMVATAITIGSALSSPDSGFSATFVNLFSPIFSGAGPYFFALIIGLTTLLLTNIINNSVTGAIMVPLMYSFATVVGANPLVVTGIIIFTSNIGLLLPCASPAGALMGGNKEWLSQKDIFKQGLICLLSIIVAIAVIGIPLGSAVLR